MPARGGLTGSTDRDRPTGPGPAGEAALAPAAGGPLAGRRPADRIRELDRHGDPGPGNRDGDRHGTVTPAAALAVVKVTQAAQTHWQAENPMTSLQ